MIYVTDFREYSEESRPYKIDIELVVLDSLNTKKTIPTNILLTKDVNSGSHMSDKSISKSQHREWDLAVNNNVTN